MERQILAVSPQRHGNIAAQETSSEVRTSGSWDETVAAIEGAAEALHEPGAVPERKEVAAQESSPVLMAPTPEKENTRCASHVAVLSEQDRRRLANAIPAAKVREE